MDRAREAAEGAMERAREAAEGAVDVVGREEMERLVGLPRALAIVGPTASGKSRLALWLAERLGLPVLCCDSV